MTCRGAGRADHRPHRFGDPDDGDTMTRLEEIVADFASVDEEMRLDLLLDYARRLPPLPTGLLAERDAGMQVVPECMTPVHLWIRPAAAGGAAASPALPRVRLHAWVADEAPTVAGMLAIIMQAFDDQPAATVARIPHDLVQQLGLARHIRMNRAVGIAAMIERIRRGAAALAAGPPPGPSSGSPCVSSCGSSAPGSSTAAPDGVRAS